MTKQEQEIISNLEQARDLLDEAVESSREVWGESELRTEQILGAWCETDNAINTVKTTT
jgi:hypothetical protein